MRISLTAIPLWLCFLINSVGFPQPATSGDSLSLRSAIKIGLKNNPQIKSSLEKIKASQGRFWSALSPAPVDISIANDYIPAGRKLADYGEQTIGISQTMEFPSNYFLRGSKYAMENDIAESEFALARLGVVLDIKKAYFKVLAAQKQLAIAAENLAITQDFAKKSQIRLQVGEGSNLERLTAQVNHSEAIGNVEIQESHLFAAFAELTVALGFGKNDSKTFLLTDSLAYIPFDFSMRQLSDEAVANNPLLKTNTLRVGLCSREKSLVWSSLLPNFNLAYFNKQSRGDPQGYYGVSLSIGVPLWFMLDQKGKIQEASANALVAQAELNLTGNSIYAKTEAAFSEFKHEEKQVRLYVKEILPQAEEIFRTALRSFEAGEITYIEFLQAQQTLINSRGNYADALLAYNLSIVSIEEAIGKTLN